MELIYADSSRVDIGILDRHDLDLAFGDSENDFELTLPLDLHCLQGGFYIYVENTEYGGIIDEVHIDTGADKVTYKGRTWQGVLASKVVVPLGSGETSSSITIKRTDSSGASLVKRYLVISGQANACIEYMLHRHELDNLFTVDASAVESVTEFQFDRYCDLFAGLTKMLRTLNRKLKIVFDGTHAVISFPEIRDYSSNEEWEADIVTFKAEQKINAPNHLICLGKGELEDRMVRHLYADADGVISQTQTFFGMDEYAAIYDYSSVESEEELLKGGRETLEKLRNQKSISTSFNADDASYDVGDIVGARHAQTGIFASGRITKKIVTIQDGDQKISYEVGE